MAFSPFAASTEPEQFCPKKDILDHHIPHNHPVSGVSPLGIFWSSDDVIRTANDVIFERGVAANQGRQGDESEWGFGQVLPVLLLAIPLSQFVEELRRNNLKTEERPPSSHTISSNNRERYEVAVVPNRSGPVRARTMPSHLVSPSYP
ncbi:hypothetical protein N7463_001969 [Penicillium fimorum]|uniref:Uncharacterized protein n=1 Tax=Penicillium fimorum TaxID=1882269 RepID=A0A9X0C7Z8_9EURO|nr:hypothetical protein N7463_001969 [Penicillium fimorum]